MNKKMNLSDKKDKFIKDHLLSDFINRIDKGDNSELITEKIGSMNIFPYKTINGIYLGSLSEPGISWYFSQDENDKTQSTESYRIFADSIFTKEQAKKFRQIITTNYNVTTFSEIAVIKDIINKMSDENDYSERWWQYAYDVMKIWNPDKFNVNLSDATAGIENNTFLFEDDYCPIELKEKLIRHGVFRDIVNSVSERTFWNKLQFGEKKKAILLLEYMGVPHTFTKETSGAYGNNYGMTTICKPILDFIEKIAGETDYPVNVHDQEYAVCELCHELVTEFIAKKAVNVFCNAVADNTNSYADGMVLKNIKDEFVPLSWDLFYKQSTSAEDDKSEEIKCESPFESLRIDYAAYSDIIDHLDNLHAFDEADESVEDYSFNVDGSEIEFYKWLWNYTQHEELIENILYYFSGDDDYRDTVDAENVEFVLEILGREEVEDKGYSFDIDLTEIQAFDKVDVVNKLAFEYESVYPVIIGNVDSLAVEEFVSRIVSESMLDLAKKSEVLVSEIWNHVYLVKGESGAYNGEYLCAKRYLNDEYEDAIFLWPSEDDNSYIMALAKYVQRKYDTTVALASAASFDWKNEYFRLIRDIRNFVKDKHDVVPMSEVFGNVVNMDDISNFGDERKVWSNLKTYKDKIISHETGDTPVNLDGWRDFLTAKYHGRCQLCGGKIAMGEQKSYFWTFRMVKESDNRLANLKSNLFCLCPACHGEMRYGNYMGKDMSEIVDKAERYSKYIEDAIEDDQFEDDFPCLVQELADEDIEIDGFHKPIICNVIINGKERNMAFSWEHFMRIAFIFSSLNDFNEDEITDDVDEFIDNSEENFTGYHGVNLNHEYHQWHGTEYVSGHWRNRNGQLEWVTGHWRTR